jgi:DNA polymerase-3 subunit epsilon
VGPNWNPKAEPLESFFDGYNMMLHGISERHVQDSPHFGEVWPEIARLTRGLPLVAHNAAFDLGVLREALALHDIEWPRLNYLCTMVLARRTWELPSYKLEFVTHAAGIEFDELMHHNARFDALMAAMVFAEILNHHNVDNVQALLDSTGVRIGELSPEGFKGCARSRGDGSARLSTENRVFTQNVDADPDGHLYGKHVAFTGRLDSMTRDAAKEEASKRGAVVQKNVNTKTEILVIGHQDSRKFGPGKKMTNNMEKATALFEAGNPIEIADETDFRAWLLD